MLIEETSRAHDEAWLATIRAQLPPLPFVTVFGSSTATAEAVLVAPWQPIGGILARAGFGVLTGGYDGTMRLVSENARAAGGVSIGITASSLADRADPDAYSRIIAVPTVFHRLEALLRLSDACFFLPGGIGTAVELLVGLWLTDRQLMRSKPLVLLGAHWQPLLAEALSRLLIFASGGAGKV